MKSKTKKAEELGLLKNKLPKSDIIVFTSFSKAGEKGLSVAQMTQLKKLLRELGSEYFVIKKTLIDLALRQAQGEQLDKEVNASVDSSASDRRDHDGLNVYGMEGSVGLVLGNDDPYKVAKSVYEFSRKNPALHFWGALLRSSSAKVSESKQGSRGQARFIDLDAFLEMAKMPTRETLIAHLLGMLTYPMRGLAVVLNEVAKNK